MIIYIYVNFEVGNTSQCEQLAFLTILTAINGLELLFLTIDGPELLAIRKQFEIPKWCLQPNGDT